MKKILYAILFIPLIGFTQTSHKPILDDPKVKYYDLEGRPVQPSFFEEKTMGWQMWFIMERTEADTVIREKVWIVQKNKNQKTSNPNYSSS